MKARILFLYGDASKIKESVSRVEIEIDFITTCADVLPTLADKDYDVIYIESKLCHDALALISKIRLNNPHTAIVIIDDSKDFSRFYEAGATKVITSSYLSWPTLPVVTNCLLVQKETSLGVVYAKQQARLRAVVDAMPNAVIFTNGSGGDNGNRVIKLVNTSFSTMFGYLPGDVMDSGLSFLFNDKDTWGVVEKKINNILDEQTILLYEQLTTKTGEFIEAELQVTRVVNTVDETVGRLIIITDISGRKKQEQQLRKLISAINQSTSAIIVMDNDGIVEWVNDSAVPVDKKENVIGRSACDTGLLTENTFSRLWQHLEAKGEFSGEMIDVSDHGATWEYVRAKPVLFNGASIGYIVTKDDISAEKKAMLQLDDRDELYRLVANNTSDWITTLMPNSTITYSSPASNRLIGYDPAELEGERFLSYIVEEDYDYFLQWLREGVTDSRLRYRLKTKGHSELWVETTVRVIKNKTTDEAVDFVFVTRDVTEQKVAQDQLIEAVNQAKSYAYATSHDLKEPLRTITVYLSFLAEQLDLSPEQKEYFGFVTGAAHRMVALIDSILNFSKISSRDMEPEQVEVSAIIQQVLDMLKISIQEKNAVVSFSNMPTVFVDQYLLKQVFLNLIGNAIKFVGPDTIPNIKIEATKDPLGWSFYVIDNGIGIPLQYHVDIFKPFYRLNSDSNSTGIGLAVVEKTVKRWGGDVSIKSSDNSGTIICFTIPGK